MSGLFRYEKFPGFGLEKENVFLPGFGGAAVTSGPVGVAMGVGVDGALESPPPDVRWS